LGYFGESLIRRFGPTPPDEWGDVVGSLNDYQLRQGMRRLAFSGKSSAPSLPEFVKLCRAIGHLDDIPDQVPALPAIKHQPVEDPWLTLANRRLLQYITTVIPANPNRYGRFPTYEALKDPEQAHLVNADAGNEFVIAVNTLVAFKNRWAELMAQSANSDGVPIPEQEQTWNECMRMAEEAIAAERAA
jgi:hypothetical protein